MQVEETSSNSSNKNPVPQRDSNSETIYTLGSIILAGILFGGFIYVQHQK